jgi:hypothetical protein
LSQFRDQKDFFFVSRKNAAKNDCDSDLPVEPFPQTKWGRHVKPLKIGGLDVKDGSTCLTKPGADVMITILRFSLILSKMDECSSFCKA